MFAMEEKLIEEVKQVKDSNEQATTAKITFLEADLEKKTRQERFLEEKLIETKSRYEKFESQVNSLADQLRDLRRTYEEECRRRKTAEEKIQQLNGHNQSLQLKIDELVHKSGSSSDMLSRLNEELVQRQQQTSKKESELRSEIESLHRENQEREIEIRNLKVEIENQKSLLTRFETKESDVEKLIQANLNELKLTRSDNEQKQRLVDDLKMQLKQLKDQMQQADRQQGSLKDELESQFMKSQKELAESRQKIVSLNDELSRLKNVLIEIENERDGYRNEIERLERSCCEHQLKIERLDEQLVESSRQFDDYRTRVENQFDSQRQNSTIISSLRTDLDGSNRKCQTLDDENRLLRGENASLASKVRELQEDIEGMKQRHQQVLDGFEFECKQMTNRAIDAESRAEQQQQQLEHLESQQQLALEEFRRQAEVEKRMMAAKLDQLEARVREQHELVIQQQELDRRTRTNSTGGEEASFEQQIDFLNSVIVDMQKKNDELRNRVQVLEEIGLGEFENSFQTQVQTTRSSSNSNGLTNGHIRTVRKYCDICEIFDSHETEDCPQQSSNMMVNGGNMVVGQEPGHTYNAVDRTQQRAYCMQCERFGHDTEQCPLENETF
ncbi:cap-gly domain-containing linker protein 1-like [Dermatophagoides farinae]|nr:cap-gly domain-containing linker protein 1-like [Dermatophagoides farinae]